MFASGGGSAVPSLLFQSPTQANTAGMTLFVRSLVQPLYLFSLQMTPGHVEVNRCDGGCFHRKQSCLPTRTRTIKIPVSASLSFFAPAEIGH